MTGWSSPSSTQGTTQASLHRMQQEQRAGNALVWAPRENSIASRTECRPALQTNHILVPATPRWAHTNTVHTCTYPPGLRKSYQTRACFESPPLQRRPVKTSAPWPVCPFPLSTLHLPLLLLVAQSQPTCVHCSVRQCLPAPWRKLPLLSGWCLAADCPVQQQTLQAGPGHLTLCLQTTAAVQYMLSTCTCVAPLLAIAGKGTPIPLCAAVAQDYRATEQTGAECQYYSNPPTGECWAGYKTDQTDSA